MRGLYHYLEFLLAEFLRDKILIVTGITDWTDYATKQILGTKVETTIVKDGTVYPPGKNGEQISNLYEKLYIKIPHKTSVNIGEQVIPVNGKATIYGQYRNQLSVKADDIRVVQPHTGPVSAPAPAPAHTSGKKL